MDQNYRITDIQIKKGNPNKAELFINNDFFIETPYQVIADLGLSVDSTITEQTLEYIQRENELTKARNDSLRFLSYRPRSAWEIKRKLLDKQYQLYIIEEVLNWLKEKEFINDRDFSLKWIKYQLGKKPVGKAKLRNELFKKGIAKEIVDSVIDSFFKQKDELELAYQLIKNKYDSNQLKNIKLDPKSTINLLKSRGFSNSVIEHIYGDFID